MKKTLVRGNRNEGINFKRASRRSYSNASCSAPTSASYESLASVAYSQSCQVGVKDGTGVFVLGSFFILIQLTALLSMDDQEQVVVGGSDMFHSEYYRGKLSKVKRLLSVALILSAFVQGTTIGWLVKKLNVK